MNYKFEILAVSCVYFQQNIDTCFNNNNIFFIFKLNLMIIDILLSVITHHVMNCVCT